MWARSCRTGLRHPMVYSSRLPLNHVNRTLAGAHDVWRRQAPTVWSRGAKRVSKKELVAAPQGALPPSDTDVQDEPAGDNTLPTVILQAYNHMQQFEKCVVLTRVGSFYELYFEQATTYAPLLNIKLASKAVSNGRRVPMAGFPFYQLDRYLQILVEDLQKYVAIAEEVPIDQATKVKKALMFDRKISRVITPGTLIDEKFINPSESNYVLAIVAGDEQPVLVTEEADGNPEAPGNLPMIGLAWADLSNGDFFTQETTTESLSAALARIAPRELLVTDLKSERMPASLSAILQEGQYIISDHEASGRGVSAWTSIAARASQIELEKFSELEISAGSFLLDYVVSRLQGTLPSLRPPMQRKQEDYMTIDRNSLKALEIKQTMKDARLEGSLIHAVRRTVTKSGHRLLSQRLISPSTSIADVNERLDLVSELLANVELRENLVTRLSLTADSWRLLQKFSFGRGDADDLLALARTIGLTEDIRKMLLEASNAGPNFDAPKPAALQGQAQRFESTEPLRLAKIILESIDEEKLSEQHQIEDDEIAATVMLAEGMLAKGGETLTRIPADAKKAVAKAKGEKSKQNDTGLPVDIWIMRPSSSKLLEKLHESFGALLKEKDDLESDLRERSGAKYLSLKWTPAYGHIIHLKGKDAQKSLSSLDLGTVHSVSSSKSTKSLYHTPWTQLGRRIDEARKRIRDEETRIFTTLRTKVIANLVALRRNAAVLDELDVAASFATLAQEKQWTRPQLNYGFSHHIVAGRHPTVEANLIASGRSFTPNDCIVGANSSSNDPRLLLITGPNMAGKSTFLRQNALVSILAQTGSYVPAAYASIGIVDAVLSRVGSADSLHSDQSTFMVEMLETAHILQSATPRSFVVMDEVGRGTTPEDGIAVGYATLKHLVEHNKCRALFATHFHALADLTHDWPNVERMCTDVVEDADGSGAWSFVHKLRKGVNRESHALKVARLAGMPESVIANARTVLQELKVPV